MGKSYAEIATEWQGSGNFPGHDTYQNGLVDSSCTRIYMAGWQNDWASATWTDDQGIEHLSASGYFTDQATIDSCTHDGRLNTNELDAALQMKLSDFSTSSYDAEGNKIQGDFQAHSNVSAYNIDHEKLSELKTENPDLYDRLTNPDGLSPDGDGIKAAYGQAEANPQHGTGGGNQYYMDSQTFKDAEDAGVFKYDPEASFSTDGSTGKSIDRTDISPEQYGEYDGGKYNNDLMAATTAEKERMDSLADERAGTGQSRAEQINSQTVEENPDRPYITNPDPAYEGNSMSADRGDVDSGGKSNQKENAVQEKHSEEGEHTEDGKSGNDDIPDTSAPKKDGGDDVDGMANRSAGEDSVEGRSTEGGMSNVSAQNEKAGIGDGMPNTSDGSDISVNTEKDGMGNVSAETENGSEREADDMPNTADGSKNDKASSEMRGSEDGMSGPGME